METHSGAPRARLQYFGGHGLWCWPGQRRSTDAVFFSELMPIQLWALGSLFFLFFLCFQRAWFLSRLFPPCPARFRNSSSQFVLSFRVTFKSRGLKMGARLG